jgi:peroxiredoxin Q/BCP
LATKSELIIHSAIINNIHLSDKMSKYFSQIAIVFTLIIIFTFSLVPVAFALGGEQPQLNQPAPEFSLPTNSSDNQSISLQDYRGQWVVLYFYPQDFTPGCTLEAQRFQQDLAQYHDLNTEIIGISADDVNTHQDFCDAEGLQFPLLADTTGEVSKIYASWLTGRSLRHTYIIDPDGILQARFLGVRPIIHSQEVLAKLKELQKV